MKIKFFMFLAIVLILSCKNKSHSKNDCKGEIKGNILTLEEGIDEGTTVCAIDTVSKKIYTIDKFEHGYEFKFIVPEGIYYVYQEQDAENENKQIIRQKGYYTEYMRLGVYKKEGNASHKPIPIKVECNKKVSGIIAGDYWGD